VQALVASGLELDLRHAGLRRQRALVAAQRGRLLREESRTEAALAELELAHALLSELAVQAPARELERDLVLVESRLAQAHADAGEHARSLELQRSTRERATRLAAEAPLDAQLALDAAAADVELAEGLNKLARYDEAESILEAALARLRELHAADPANQLPRQRLVEALEGLGVVARSRGATDRAVELFEEAFELAGVRLAGSRGDELAGLQTARLANALGDALWAVGAREEATQTFERALELLRDAGEVAFARQLRFSAEIGLADAAAAREGPEAVGGRLEELHERADRDRTEFPEAAWPLRNRGLAGWRLASVLEARSGDPARAAHERVALLARARSLFLEGRETAEHMAERGWLTPDEQRRDVAALFAADVARVDAALGALGVSPDS
ncbi:MAG TPA: tetratricopeptide repeat protein, partial [Planctomycetota bacterium]|nr:tetratricopeptide repeat protein [Planctomycetota bacterium]